MLKDIIQESPRYELARQFGEERGEARGRKEGEAQGLRKACLAVVQVQGEQLEKLVDLSMAQDAEAAKAALVRLG